VTSVQRSSPSTANKRESCTILVQRKLPLESVLTEAIEVLILKNLKPFRMNTYEKRNFGAT